MRNFKNKERDKLPIIVPPIKQKIDPYTRKVIFRNEVLTAYINHLERRLTRVYLYGR